MKAPRRITQLAAADQPEALVAGIPADLQVDRRTRGLPEDLNDIIDDTQAAPVHTAHEITRRQAGGDAGTASALEGDERLRSMSSAALQKRLRDIDAELAELDDVARLRQVRNAVREGGPMSAHTTGTW